MKKRLFALCIALTLLCTMLPAYAEEAEFSKYGDKLTIGDAVEILPAFEGSPDYISNGGLEGTDSIPGWSPQGGKWGNKAFVDTQVTHSGNSALRITDTEGKRPWIRQFFPVMGGSTYQLVFWMKSSGVANPLVKLEHYSDATIDAEFSSGNTSINPGDAGLSTEWTQVSFLFKPNAMTSHIALYLRINSTEGKEATVWFDDVSLKMVEAPSRYSMDINSYNYYTSENIGYSTFKVNKAAYKDYSDWSVDWRVLKGEEVLCENKGLSLALGSAEIEFDLTRCDDRDAVYTFESTLSVGDEGAVEKKSVNFKRRYPRPTTMGEDGFFYDDGEIYTSVTAYHLNASKYDLIDKFGLKVVQLAHGYVLNPDKALQILDQIHERGAKGMVCLYLNNKIASHPDNQELVKEYIKAIKHHPAILGWAVDDEPLIGGADESLITQAYELVHELDDKHPVYTVDQREHTYPGLVRNADYIGIDNYPYGSHNAMEYIYSSTKTAVKLAEKSGKPVIPILQLMSRGSGTYSNGQELYFPSGNAMRNMIYQTLMAGAKSWGYFAFDWELPDGTLTYATPTGDAICEFAEKEQELMIDYFLKKKYPTFNSNYEDNPDYRYFSFVKDGSVYMVILNRHEYVQTKAEIPLLSNNGLVQLGSFRAAPYAGTAEGASGIKTLSVTLEPGAAAVYKISSNNKIREELLVNNTSPITDLGNHEWAREQVEELYRKSIVNLPSENMFEPGENITRGDFAGFLVRTLGLENEAGEQFADVPADHLFAKEIAVGRAAGILNGVAENSYAPDAPITRQDMMTLIARGLSLKGKADLTRFPDAGSVSDYAKEGVCAMISTGLISGNSDGTLNPVGNTTRAEAAVLMSRILDVRD